jgi:hypothetical protein
MRGRGGHAAHFLVILIATVTASGLLVMSRPGFDPRAREAEAVRLQALWLARSALDTDLAGTHTVETDEGPARVEVRNEADGVMVVVSLAGAVAEVRQVPYTERFQRAP